MMSGRDWTQKYSSTHEYLLDRGTFFRPSHANGFCLPSFLEKALRHPYRFHHPLLLHHPDRHHPYFCGTATTSSKVTMLAKIKKEGKIIIFP
jgi:hypothetical protein